MPPLQPFALETIQAVIHYVLIKTGKGPKPWGQATFPQTLWSLEAGLQ